MTDRSFSKGSVTVWSMRQRDNPSITAYNTRKKARYNTIQSIGPWEDVYNTIDKTTDLSTAPKWNS